MAESQKCASSSMKLKEKNLLLDLDIGKDFLNSWKSMSMAEGDEMDFDFEPVSKGKKNIFSFDKVDVDFNLDDDFGKISSFNMDISDLGISSPPGEDPKFKEKLKVLSSSGDIKGKSDRFTYAFDFNELESFSFEPNLEKGPEALENKEIFESSPNESGCHHKEDTSNMNMIENTSTSDEEIKKPPVSGTTIDFDMDCQVDKSASELAMKNCPSVLETGYSVTSITIEEGASDKSKTSSEPTIATRSEAKRSQSEKLISPDRIAFDSCVRKNAIPDLSSNSPSNNEPSFGKSTDFLDKVGLTGSVGEQNANVPISVSSFNKYMTSENSYQPQRAKISEKNNSEKIQDGIEIHVKGNKESTELGQVVSLVEKSCMTSIISGQFSDIPTSIENQKTMSAIQKLLSVSQAVDNPISEEETKLHEACSMSLLPMVKAESNVQKASSTQTRVSLLSSKKVGLTQRLIDRTRDSNSIPSDRKLALLSSEHLKTSREVPQKMESRELNGAKD